MRIAIAQINAITGDFDRTVERMVAIDGLASRNEVDLLIYPSTTLTGYDPAGLLDSEDFSSDISRALDELAAKVSVPCVVPFLLDFGGSAIPETALIRDGRVVPLRMASYLANLSSSHVLAGEELPIQFSSSDIDFGVVHDYAGLESYASGAYDADVIIYLPFESFDTDDEATVLAPSVADGCYLRETSEANSWLVAVAGVGGHDDVVFCGGSFVMTPWGELAAVAPSFEESVTLCDIDPVLEGPLAKPAEAPSYQRIEFLWDALTVATRDFAEKQSMDGMGIVLTGDLLTSALAVLAVDALGPTRVHGLISPVGGTKAASDARALAKRLGISTTELAADELEGAAALLGSSPASVGRDLVRARLTAMFSGEGLLLGTAADKTAMACGQDPDGFHDAEFAPFCDVYRTDLIAMVAQRNRRSPVVGRQIMERLDLPEGLGLEAVARTDEARLSELDALLLRHIEHGASLTELVADGVDEAFATAVLERVRVSELDRRGAPLGPVISDCALFERARPVVCAWRDRYRPELIAESNPEEGADSADELIDRFSTIAGDIADLPIPSERADAKDLSSYLQDFARSGGLRADGDDIWGAGLFSKN